MKSQVLHKLYNEIDINFLVNPNDSNVMINATQMAKAFGKEPKDFLRLDGTKKYIEALAKSENIVADLPRYNEIFAEKIMNSNNKAGTFFHRKLALKFAAWLDVEFELWVFNTIDDILFGNYKKHWDAHAEQERAKAYLEELKEKMLLNPTQEIVVEYFRTEEIIKNTATEKRKAIKQQTNLFNYMQENN